VNEDGRARGWMKEIWKRRERVEKKGVGDTNKNIIFWKCGFYVFLLCNQESESSEGK
jgi:hypothetical protein